MPVACLITATQQVRPHPPGTPCPPPCPRSSVLLWAHPLQPTPWADGAPLRWALPLLRISPTTSSTMRVTMETTPSSPSVAQQPQVQVLTTLQRQPSPVQVLRCGQVVPNKRPTSWAGTPPPRFLPATPAATSHPPTAPIPTREPSTSCRGRAKRRRPPAALRPASPLWTEVQSAVVLVQPLAYLRDGAVRMSVEEQEEGQEKGLKANQTGTGFVLMLFSWKWINPTLWDV